MARTVSLQGSLMVEMVPHHRCRVVQHIGYLPVVLAVLDDLRQQVDIIPSACFNELLSHRRSLEVSISRRQLRVGAPAQFTSKASAISRGVGMLQMLPGPVRGRNNNSSLRTQETQMNHSAGQS